MKRNYQHTSGFFAGVLSVFDMGAALQEKNSIPAIKGLSFDAQQLSDDLTVLTLDYKKATDKVLKEDFGDRCE